MENAALGEARRFSFLLHFWLMKPTDYLWQYFIDQEKQRLMNRPAEELLTMDFFTDCQKGAIRYGIWHEAPPWRNLEIHSFILKAPRKLFPGFYRNYLAGFSIDDTGTIIPISDDILYSHD